LSARRNFQSTDPTIDSQMVILQNSGADALFLFTYAKQAAQAISKMSDLKWKPETYLHLGAASVGPPSSRPVSTNPPAS